MIKLAYNQVVRDHTTKCFLTAVALCYGDRWNNPINTL